MPIVSQNRRPPFRYAESSSSSLTGLEQVLPRRSPLFDVFQDAANFSEKPLPPTPKQRKSSSVYSAQTAEIIDAYAEESPEDEYLSSEVFFVPAIYTTDTVAQTDPGPSRPKLQKNGEQSHTISEPIVASRRQKVPTLEPSKLRVRSDQIIYQHSNSSASKTLKSKSKDSVRAANAATKSRRADLESLSSAPPTFRTIQYSEHDYPRGPPSSRITDVVDHSLVPSPLRFSKIDDSDRPSSHFSTTSTDTETSSRHDSRSSFRKYARKAVRRRQGSPEEIDNEQSTSLASNRTPHMSLPPPPRQGRFGSISSQRRASIQNGLSNMYDTLTSLSIGPSKSRSTMNASARSPVPREPRTPAIPITPYQHMGTKAWEVQSRTSKLKAPKKSPFSFFPRSRRAVVMAASKRPTLRKTDSEKRREALKKKIVLVGPADHYPRI